jgi:quercetin dioxygenase-like cupin family protein
VTTVDARVFDAPWGRHWVLSDPALTGAAALMLVRVRMPPGRGHQFHTHPESDEIIYVVDGTAEQWVDREKRRLKAGESAYIPRGVVHATYNSTKRPLTFLAILSPASSAGPFVVDCWNEEPWRRLRKPLAQGPLDLSTGRPT